MRADDDLTIAGNLIAGRELPIGADDCALCPDLAASNALSADPGLYVAPESGDLRLRPGHPRAGTRPADAELGRLRRPAPVAVGRPAGRLRRVAPTLLFDLDDTLVVEERAAVATFAATAQLARPRDALDPARLALAARTRARELWRAAPTYPYCLRVGISSWEGLWCRFEGDDASVRALRSWAPDYRQRSWKLALADQGVRDDELAAELGERFGIERRRRHEAFADAVSVLSEARRSHRLGLVTNGASCLQREKLAGSGLAGLFDAVVVSGDLGVGKPDPHVFQHALALLDGDPGEATMVGDSLTRDVDGAIAAGLRAIWVNRFGRPRPAERPDVVEIAALTELAAALR